MNDLYLNDAPFIYLRLDGVYYQRILGKGWRIITADQAGDVSKWAPLHPNQLAVYRPVLVAQGLINS